MPARCDRCQAPLDGPRVVVRAESGNRHHAYRTPLDPRHPEWELCPDCASALLAFLASPLPVETTPDARRVLEALGRRCRPYDESDLAVATKLPLKRLRPILARLEALGMIRPRWGPVRSRPYWELAANDPHAKPPRRPSPPPPPSPGLDATAADLKRALEGRTSR